MDTTWSLLSSFLRQEEPSTPAPLSPYADIRLSVCLIQIILSSTLPQVSVYIVLLPTDIETQTK